VTVPCKVNNAEMREAFRLNLTPSFWWKAALGNFRTILYLSILIAFIAHRIIEGRAIEWQAIVVMSGLVVLFFGLYLLRLHRSIIKSAKKLSETCDSMVIDSQGLTAVTFNGSRTFVPWSVINRWREGKLVFTIGDAKTFRTVPKGALGEMQSGELRSLLVSQIR
jgi:hypothetical protein